MTPEEFLKKYHSYCVQTEREALLEIESMEIVEGHLIQPIEFPGLGWALMLDTAAQEIKRLGII